MDHCPYTGGALGHSWGMGYGTTAVTDGLLRILKFEG
jgi:hypothetical protein